MYLLISKHLKYSYIFLFVLFTSCAPKIIPVTQNKPEVLNKKNIFLADPTIFYNKGIYYLYGTGAGQYADGFAVYTSKDLQTWKGAAGCMQKQYHLLHRYNNNL